MRLYSIKYIFLLLLSVIVFSSCQDKWEEHVELQNPDLNQTLFDIVNGDSEYSKFADLLNKSGYANELKSSKNFTLILPTNAAIDEVSSIINLTDTLELRKFVGYHIMNSIYNVNTTSDTLRARNLRYKYIDFVNSTFDEINPVKSNIVAANGVYHVVNKALTPYFNIYNFLVNFSESNFQKEAIQSFDTLDVNFPDSIVYKRSPTFNTNVRRHMINEGQKYTYFVLRDDFYVTEYTKLLPYHQTSYTTEGLRPDSTTAFFTKMNMLRNLIVPGNYSVANMPDTLTAISGFKFQVDKTKIISTHKVSNGTVYYVSSLPYKLKDQISEFKILGNLPSGFSQGDKRANTYYRNKLDNNGLPYNDIEVYGHKISQFYISYNHRATNSVKYKIYGRAISGLLGDPQTIAFNQYIHFMKVATGTFDKPIVDALGATVTKITYAVTPLNHNEVYLGEYTQEEFGTLNLRLTANTGSTDNTQPLILEYLRFEPILP